MRILAICLTLLVLATPALACSPVYDPRTLVEKAAGRPELFVGKVVEVGADFIVMQVLSSRGTPTIGENLRKTHGGYGTCGKLTFTPGDVWLYDTDMPLSLSQKLTPEDLGADHGSNIDALIARLQAKANTPVE